jgi:AraC-like DNA-binding protein
MPAVGKPALFVSTDRLAPNERLPYWRDVFGRTIVKLDIEPLEGPFQCDATLWSLPGVSVAAMTTSPTRVSRTREHIADGTDDFVLSVPREGTAAVSNLGRDASIAEGGGVLTDSAEPSSLVFRSPSRFVVLAIPKPVLLPMIGEREAALMRPIAPDSAPLRLLGEYLDLLMRSHTLGPSELLQHAAAHVHDLVALAVGATRDAARLASGRGARAARFAAIRSDILSNLSQVRLSPGFIARRHAVTERYVHLLFADSGETFGEFVNAARLDRARALLLESPHVRIADVARRVGYGEITTFNRAFRRRFGATPSDLRGGLPSG